MRRPRKNYFVILPNAEKHRMMEWLRANPQHVPEERDPNDPKINTQRWRAILEQNGWRVRETDAEVHLIFPDENGEDDLETPMEKSPKIRRPSKKYLVLISEDEKYPMKQWLRENRQHVPEGKDPDDPSITSQMWRGILKRNGWEDRETDSEVHLIFPSEDKEEDVESPSAFALEHHLRDFIAENIEKISFNRKTLKLYQNHEGRSGKEYPTDTGRIDILAVSMDKQEYFVLELKLSRGSDQAVGQLMRYMSWVEDKIADGKEVNGIIVAQSIDDRLKRAARMISSRVKLFKYELKFKLDSVSLTLD